MCVCWVCLFSVCNVKQIALKKYNSLTMVKSNKGAKLHRKPTTFFQLDVRTWQQQVMTYKLCYDVLQIVSHYSTACSYPERNGATVLKKGGVQIKQTADGHDWLWLGGVPGKITCYFRECNAKGRAVSCASLR